ncbi:MAG: hypothetical protein U0W40_13540 [Acidimicrobiia bacterium]
MSGVMSLGYGSVYTLLADLRDEYGFTGTQLGLSSAAGFFAGFGAQLGLARPSPTRATSPGSCAAARSPPPAR